MKRRGEKVTRRRKSFVSLCAVPPPRRRRAATVLSFIVCVLLPLLVISTPPTENLLGKSSAQTDTLHRWGAVTLFHGLPSDRVRAIVQDRDGHMWFGTDAGLARYDGRRTQTVASENLTARRILALKLDEDGALWVGTNRGALVRAAVGEEFKAVPGTENRAVAAIATTPDRGRVVMATSDGSVLEFRRNNSNGAFDVRALVDAGVTGAGLDDRSPFALTSLAVEGDTIFVGTRRRGLLAIRGGEVKEIVSRPVAYFVETLERDAQGRLWIGAQTTRGDSGLYRREADVTTRPAKILAGATGTVSSLRFGADGDLWVGTDGQGVFRYRDAQRLERFTFAGTAGGLRSDRIYSIFVDREEVVWFGTDRGVCRYDPHALEIEQVSTEAQSNFVRTLFQMRSGRLLVGSNRGLFVRDKTAAAWRPVEALANKTIYAIAEDEKGKLLVASASGLYVGIDPARKSVSRSNPEAAIGVGDSSASKEPTAIQVPPANEATIIAPVEPLPTSTADDKAVPTPTPPAAVMTIEPAVSGNVRAIAKFQGATYIAVYGRGVERLDGTERRTLIWPNAERNAREREVVSLHADDANRLWIGTASSGVFFFDGKEVQSEPRLEKLRGAAVRSMSGTSSNWLWFATARGLYAYRPQTSELVEAAPGLDARSVIDDSRTDTARGERGATPPQAWCATAGGGLLKVSIDERFGAVIARLDAERGLPSQNAFAVLSLSEEDENNGGDQALLIGTSRGVARYEPGQSAPALTATRVTTSRTHSTEELRAGLHLEHPQNSFVLDVAAASSRTFPEQFQYAFLLLDGAGRVVRRKLSHDAQFQVENLSPGRYRVEAWSYTADLIPSTPFAFALEVADAPFPWTTAALSVLLALALVALIWGTVQNRVLARTGVALLDANRQLADARLQLANETETERRRIARDLHDQTLADLRRLLLMTDEIHADGTNGDAARQNKVAPLMLRAEIESISNEIRRICEDLSPSVLENVGLAAALEWALAERVTHIPADCKFTYEFTCDEDLEERLRFPPGVQIQLYRIVQEAVSNVCRHAGATHVQLDVSAAGQNELMLTLEDNGHGFDPDNKKARLGRGLANIRARASIIDAEVEWSKRPTGGVRFTLRKASTLN